MDTPTLKLEAIIQGFPPELEAIAENPKRTSEDTARITADIVAQLRLMADHIERQGLSGVWGNVADNRDHEGYARAQVRLSRVQPYTGLQTVGPHCPRSK